MKPILAVLILSIASFVHAEPKLEGTPSQLERYLSGIPKTAFLSGEGEVSTTADNAIVTLLVKTEKSSLTKAIQENRNVRSSLINTLVQKGIAKEKIKDSKFSAIPDYGWFKEKPKSYKVTNTVTVELASEKQLDWLGEIIDKTSEVFYRGVEMKKTEESKVKNLALKKALDDVNTKRRIYEAKLGVKLTTRKIHQQAVYDAQPVFRHMKRAMAHASAEGAAKKIAKVGHSDSSSFGELKYRANVQIEYLITPLK